MLLCEEMISSFYRQRRERKSLCVKFLFTEIVRQNRLQNMCRATIIIVDKDGATCSGKPLVLYVCNAHELGQ